MNTITKLHQSETVANILPLRLSHTVDNLLTEHLSKISIETRLTSTLIFDCSRSNSGDHEGPVFHGYFHHLQWKS